MELNSPTAKIDHMAIKPVVFMEIRMRVMAPNAKNDKTLAGATIFVNHAPINRPIIAPLQ